MQGLWYGDRRDRVKWGALVYLADREKIPCIVQVAYFRHGTDLKLQTEEGEVELPKEVWDHFSDLKHIKRIECIIGLKISVLNQEFKPDSRLEYINKIILELKKIKCRKIVFLDPDTGIEPKTGKPEHVTTEDLQQIWNNEALLSGDLLVVYQHADRTKKWLPDRKKTMSNACGDVEVKTITGVGIASDVAILWCCKDHATVPKSHVVSPNSTKKSRIKNVPRLCACQCGEMTSGNKGVFFRSGHDEKLKSKLKEIESGIIRKPSESLAKIYDIWILDKSRPLKDIAKEVLG